MTSNGAGFQPVERTRVELYPAGVQPDRWQPGDFLLTRGDSVTAALIRFGQRLRIHGEDRRYTCWNHAALVVGADGLLVEALGAGVQVSPASKYHGRAYHLVRIRADEQDRREVAEFGQWAVQQHCRYGFATIASVALTLLTGAKFSFFIEGQLICSGLVARAQERTGVLFSRDPAHMSPADLAKYYRVEEALVR
ncbi:hypothetical protein [Micromonospora cathayae]|uniref:Permuted papain-like amidase enzyme, YaeF/YiiX, C92 family n=1 Tax=Micromonospora cathayae TaxID=3028804 RepID=A0ABY7ZPA0_9ACTN|nr:hypothetical protein [Micromonospora sp. HUAS 3]WDZ83774.1 hypothetical protein PVK37_25425 [Micromonospora sp. HUAS 3]